MDINLQSLVQNNIFLDNEYLHKYMDLITNAKKHNYNQSKLKTQKHHIIPRSYFNHNNLEIDNSSNNLVKLIYSEHVLAHYYLSLICNNIDDKFANQQAFLMMINEKLLPTEQELIIKLPQYNEIYDEATKINSAKASKRLLGHKTSDSTKTKIGKANKYKYVGLKTLHKGNSEIRCLSTDIDKYLKEGYEIGRSSKTIKSMKANYNYSSKGMLGKSQSEFQKLQASKALKGKSKSLESKKAMSNAHKNKILIANDILNISKYIDVNEFDDYKKLGYRKGRLKRH